MLIGVLIIVVFAGALLWDFLGQPTKFRHLGRRRGSIGRSRGRSSRDTGKDVDDDAAA
jgi:hypothetical protein